MAGLSVKLPLSRDPDDGVALNKDFKDLVRQNLTMILLTIPGERMMLPEFGVGLKNYLFELDTMALRSEIGSKIRSQVSRYLTYIDIINLEFNSSGGNLLSIRIDYFIKPINMTDVLDVSRNDNDITVF
jgi:phage baseplate assembly protein W